MKETTNNEEISIKIQTLDNTYSFKINQSLTILDLKEEISKKFKIPKDRQRLIFQGKFLKENEKLSFYKITDGCVVQLIAKSLEENNNTNQTESHNRNNNGRLNEIYPIIQIPFRTNRRRRRVAMPHFDITEYFEGFYQNLISLDNINKCKINNCNYNNNIIEAFDFSKSTYEVGEWVDVKDTINQWLEAQVIKVQNEKAYVHYNGWGTRWDEWIEFSSPRMRNFKTYTLQTPLAFSVSPYPAIPCDSYIEPQQRPIDIFYYVEKTKNHLERLLDDMNKILNLRKKNNPPFKDDKFNRDNYEILFKATQMIPFLDRVGRMLSDISLIFSHFVVNPNYYSSFLFGYKRQDLLNEIIKIKKNKNNNIFDENDDDNDNDNNNDNNNKNKINVIKNTTKNQDTQTPPLENKYLKKMQAQTQNQTKQSQNELEQKNVQKKKDDKNSINEINEIKTNEDHEKLNIIKDDNNNANKNKDKNNKDDLSKKEDKKGISIKEKEENDNKNNINIIKEKKEDKNDDKKNTKNNNKNIKDKDKDKDNINEDNENQTILHRHNSYSAPITSEDNDNVNTANFQRQRQRINQEEILPNQIATNLGYDLSFSSVELPFIQRIIYSYTMSDRIISPLSPFYQTFSNKKLFPRVNMQIPTMLPPGEVIMMTGYSPFPEPNLDIYIHTISENPNQNNENEGNNNNRSNNNNNSSNNNSNANNSNNNNGNTNNNRINVVNENNNNIGNNGNNGHNQDEKNKQEKK